MKKSRLLMKEQPLIVDKTLAKLIGLNEAIVLQQIEYWTNIKEKADTKNKKTIKENYADGFYWTYNTVEEWSEEFPFWSYDTVKRTLKKLRDNNYIITSNYNKKAYDRTLWYRVNHEEIIKLDEKNSLGANYTNEETSEIQEEKRSEALKTDISAKCPNGKVQNALMEKCKMPQPIPKTSTKTSTKISFSSSSKGKAPNSIHPLIELFNSSICELKNTTLIKFQNYIQEYNEDFIEAVINYCEERNGKSFTYFEKTIQGFIEQKATTPKLMEEAIDKFNSENKTKKNNALKAKDEKKQEESFEQFINDRIMEDLGKGFEPETAIAITGEDINNQVKNIIKPKLSETLFNTWIKSLDFRFNNDTVIIGCPNSFTKEIVDKRYINIIMEAISLLSLNKKLKTIVMS